MDIIEITFKTTIITSGIYSIIWLLIDMISISMRPKRDYTKYAEYIIDNCSFEERKKWLYYAMHGITPPDHLVDKYKQNQEQRESKGDKTN